MAMVIMAQRPAIMVPMQRGTDTPPLVTGGLQVLAAVAVALSAAFLAESGAQHLLTGFGLFVMTTVGVVGLFVARGKWARRYLSIVLLTEAATYVVFGFHWVVLLLIAAAAVGLGLPGLDGWMRQLRKVDAPPNSAVLLPLSLVGVPVLMGLVRSPNLADWTLSILAVVAGWSYARAHRATLWGIRFAFPVLGLVVAFSQSGWPSLAVALAVGAITALAWQPGTLGAVQPLEVPRGEVKPVFAEMSPAGLMEEIGRDERGRKNT